MAAVDGLLMADALAGIAHGRRGSGTRISPLMGILEDWRLRLTPEARGAGASTAGEARTRSRGSDPQRRERSACRADREPHARTSTARSGGRERARSDSGALCRHATGSDAALHEQSFQGRP